MGVKVLSLFGGIECGKVAMDRLGWDIETYYSAEIDEYAKTITSAEHPDIIHLGGVKEVSYHSDARVLQAGDRSCLAEIDILIGGPPCQDLSSAKSNRKGLEGDRSSLFYEYVRILKEVQPKYFLMENVASMKNEDKETITKALREVYPNTEVYMVPSQLVSGQKRKRYYWTNIEKIEQPKDRGIKLEDILEEIPFDTEDMNYTKKAGSWKMLEEKYINEALKKKVYEKSYAITAKYSGVCPRDCLDKYNRQIILGVWQKPRGKNEGGIVQNGEKAPTVNASKFEYNNLILGQFRRTNLRIHADQEKCCTLTANMGTGGNNVPIIINPTEEIYYWRPLTPVECERLQTLPDNYTNHVAKTRRYKAIGNGWTVEVIAHILGHIKEWKK